MSVLGLSNLSVLGSSLDERGLQRSGNSLSQRSLVLDLRLNVLLSVLLNGGLVLDLRLNVLLNRGLVLDLRLNVLLDGSLVLDLRLGVLLDGGLVLDLRLGVLDLRSVEGLLLKNLLLSGRGGYEVNLRFL